MLTQIAVAVNFDSAEVQCDGAILHCRLTQIRVGCINTAAKLIQRAGLPAGWRLADKTGTGNSDTGTAGDVGVLWSPSGKPIIIAVYLTRARVSRAEQEAAIADIGRWVREELQSAA